MDFLIPQLNRLNVPRVCRTIVVLYHSQTSEVAFRLLNSLSCNGTTPKVAMNLDDPNLTNRMKHNFGNCLYSYCVIESISNKTIVEKSLEQIENDHRNYVVYMVMQKANEAEISEFFQLLWTKLMVNVCAIFCSDILQMYTFFPYEERFAVEVFRLQWNQSDFYFPDDIFGKAFMKKVNNLHNKTVEVFIAESLPKAYRVPGRYHWDGSKFYFSGRDGLIAKIAEEQMQVKWKYRALIDDVFDKIMRVSVFNSSDKSFRGDRLKFNEKNPSNAVFIHLSENDTMA